MEILNNIWVALTTPNETLIGIINFFALPIESTLVMLLFCAILKIENTKKQSLIWITLNSISLFISNLLLEAPFNVVINLLLSFLYIKFIFNIKFLQALIAQICPYILIVLLELIIVNLYSYLTKIDTNFFMTIPIYKILIMSTIYILLYFIYKKLKNSNLSFYFLEHLSNKNKLTFILNFILGIISIATQSYLTSFYGNNFPIYVIILSFISLLTYFIISIYSLFKASKLESTTLELESAEAYNKTLTVLHDNVRCFKHDFDNIVTTIGGYVKTDDMEGLKQYYYELEKDCQHVNDLSALNPKIINNNGVYNLLTAKYIKAANLNVEMHLEFFLDLNTLNMKIYDFTKILGILIDNAIEAASECDEKDVYLKFRNEDKRNRQLIIIENTYNDNNLNTEKIFEKGISGKENHTGLGLWEVRKIIKKNNNINLFTTKDKKLFKQQLEIYYKNNKI